MPLATAPELASYLQQDLDASTANLALTTASGLFEREANTKFASTAATWVVEGCGQTVLAIPHYPLISITQVRVDSAVISSTDYSLVGQNLYRLAGWGGRLWHPQKVEVDLTYGYTSVPDEVKLAALDIAAGLYQNPTSAVSEQIDDYTVRYEAGTAILPGPDWQEIAAKYRFGGFA